MAFRYDIAALCVVAAVALWLIYRRDRARTKAARAAYFDDCSSLFEDCRIVQEGTDFPILEGRHRGRLFRLEPVVDHMAVRKLPSLWVKVSLIETDDEGRRQLRFLIEGLLRMEPNPEQVVFDTVLEISSGEYHVKGDASA